MVLYNESELNAATNLYDITLALNTLSGGVLMNVIMLILFFFFVIMFRNTGDMKKVLLGSSFITTIIGAVFWGVGLVPMSILILPIILVMITIFINIWG